MLLTVFITIAMMAVSGCYSETKPDYLRKLEFWTTDMNRFEYQLAKGEILEVNLIYSLYPWGRDKPRLPSPPPGGSYAQGIVLFISDYQGNTVIDAGRSIEHTIKMKSKYSSIYYLNISAPVEAWVVLSYNSPVPLKDASIRR